MLSSAALSRLEQMQLAATRRLAGEIAGEHRSNRFGSTIDFADFREYVPGDDTRRIDLHQLARLDVLRIKLYEATDDLVVRVVLDRSASMGMHGKADTAADVVAAIGAVALANGDVLVVSTFPDGGPPRRFRGRRGLRALIDHLGTVEQQGETELSTAARAALTHRGPPGMTMVVSDLLAPQWRQAISSFPTRGGDLLVAQVLADDEVQPDLTGDLSLVDVESGARLPVSLSSDQLRRFRRRARAWRADVRRRTLQVGGRYLPVPAGADVESLLLAEWRAAGVVR